MNTKVALLVIYNHRFDKNIPRLDVLYEGRFSHVFHIVPFYDGNQENVIPVYEHSYQFSGYIAQACSHLKGKGFTHYFVVADDMVLNPLINEDSLWNEIGITKEDCLLDSLNVFQTYFKWWRHDEALNYTPEQRGVEVLNILPKYDEAVKLLHKHNIPYGPIPRHYFHRCPPRGLRYKRYFGNTTPRYPLVGGYSDIFLFTENVREKFAQYCGAFAATRLFVEIAIPTAMLFAADKVKYIDDCKLKDGAVWTNEEKDAIEEKYHKNIQELNNNYPEGILFLHPVKLSRWS